MMKVSVTSITYYSPPVIEYLSLVISLSERSCSDRFHVSTVTRNLHGTLGRRYLECSSSALSQRATSGRLCDLSAVLITPPRRLREQSCPISALRRRSEYSAGGLATMERNACH